MLGDDTKNGGRLSWIAATVLLLLVMLARATAEVHFLAGLVLALGVGIGVAQERRRGGQESDGAPPGGGRSRPAWRGCAPARRPGTQGAAGSVRGRGPWRPGFGRAISASTG